MKFVALILTVFLFHSGFAQDYYLLAGTYTKTTSKGIYVYTFNSKTGGVKLVSTTFTDNPSYFAMDEKTNFLYSVNELGGGKGAVSSFAFDRKSGKLKFVNTSLTQGDDPCYIQLDKENKWAAVANYSGGNFSVFPIKNDGTLGEVAEVIQHTGTGPDKDRQEMAHVHSTVFTPDNKFLAVADLGMDQVTVYPFDASADKPVTDEPITLSTMPGSGPSTSSFIPQNNMHISSKKCREILPLISTLTKARIPSRPSGRTRLVLKVSVAAPPSIFLRMENFYMARTGENQTLFQCIPLTNRQESSPRLVFSLLVETIRVILR